MAAGWLYLTLASGAGERLDLTPSFMGRHSERANLARAFPARHVVLMELHELDRRGHGLLLVPQLEDRVAADHLLRLHERAIDDPELSVRDAHLGTHGNRHQPAVVDHAASLDPPVGELAHRLHQCRRRRARRVGRWDAIHEAHPRNSSLGEPRAPSPSELSRYLRRRTS